MLSRIIHTALMTSATAACLLLAGCETPAGKVTTLSGDTSQLAVGTTYAWAPVADPGGGDPRVDNSIIGERLKSAVDNALATKGYRQVDPANAKVLVAYHIGLKQGTDYTATTMGGPVGGGVACGRRGCVGGYGWGAYGAPIDTDITAVSYTEGTLMLDLVDASSGKLAWRGTSQKRVDAKDADQAQLNAVLLDLTKDMPGLAAVK